MYGLGERYIMVENLRFGIVGTGMIANAIAKAIVDSETAELAAVSSRQLETAQSFAKQYGAVKAFDSWQQMVAWDGIDAVYVAVPTAVEESVCVVAAQAGKHVLADKPFANLPSLQRITAACRRNNVVFMDATHFVHHPRTQKIHHQIKETLGAVQAIHSAFFFPLMDSTNIRFNPHMEPTGALGDMAWYSIRAAVEFLPANVPLKSVEVSLQRDDQTNAIIRATGLLVFENGMTSTWAAGYNAGVCIMDLDILGTNGLISLNDFVLDWAKSFAFNNPDHQVGYTLRTGVATPKDFQFIPTPSAKSQHTLMIENFVSLSRSGQQSDLYGASIRSSEETQRLLDLIWEKAHR
uniref:Oxidoreductase domain protein n=1 Tax=Cyanothece sp. (strain PCC 7425 / ATCC 29141) TaxID=395961 RepID=B8HL06_CYAP4